MAVLVFTDASVVINSVDLSDHVRRVAITQSTDMQDITAMGDTWRGNLAGTKEWTAEVELFQDFGSSSVDDTLNGLIGGSAVTCVFKPTSGAVSATNPSYTGSAILSEYPVISGEHGQSLMVSITLTGNGALTRATA